jgi:membrane protease YdiL (CAAX protease family)
MRELGRTLTYTVPSLLLLWVIIPTKSEYSPLERRILPGRKDIVAFLVGLPGLIIIGTLISFIMGRVQSFPLPPSRIAAPVTVPGWIILSISCLGTGYLEETFFRFYIIQKIEELNPSRTVGIVFSTLLFAICHIYEGPWGVANAVLAGLLLSCLFEKWRVIHGIAWAHGAYNAFVYVSGLLS